MNILILYGTIEGQTAKVAERVADILRSKGQQVTILCGEHLPAGFETNNFNAAIIGGPIHMGDYPAYLKKFVTTHSNWLNNVPSALFTVCMAIHSQREKSTKEAKRFGKDFVAQAGWQPKLNETFAGAVKYTQYNFITRFIMKLISKREGSSTDTSRDHEYTDWEAVVRFSEKFLVEITERESV